MKWHNVFVGNFDGRLLSEVLMEWAEDNEVHELGEVCHCDVCQIFVPMASQLEQAIQQTTVPVKAADTAT